MTSTCMYMYECTTNFVVTYQFNLTSCKGTHCILANQTDCIRVHSISSFEGNVIFTDKVNRQIKMMKTSNRIMTNITGTGQSGNDDGIADFAKFTQLQGICSEDRTIYVTDAVTGCVKIVTGWTSTTLLTRIMILNWNVQARALGKST